ncbi:14303_t:CDS:2, partial [Acaulospora morrowiae]
LERDLWSLLFSNIGLGLANQFNPQDRMPGWDCHSIGYHGDDGLLFTNSTEGAKYGPLYTTGDTVGCGINFFENSIFFTKNGMNLGNAVENYTLFGPLYPTMGLISKDECVEVNFGAKPFEYDIEFHAKMVFQKALMFGKKVKPEYD